MILNRVTILEMKKSTFNCCKYGIPFDDINSWPKGQRVWLSIYETATESLAPESLYTKAKYFKSWELKVCLVENFRESGLVELSTK